jgi:uncharacterized coiled-coil protein SlyX
MADELRLRIAEQQRAVEKFLAAMDAALEAMKDSNLKMAELELARCLDLLRRHKRPL